jgi:N-acetylneuraminic acid mutarotase
MFPLIGAGCGTSSAGSDLVDWQTIGLGIESRNSIYPALAASSDILFVLDSQTPNGGVDTAIYEIASDRVDRLKLSGLEWRGRYAAAWTGTSILVWGGLESPIIGELSFGDLTWTTTATTSIPSGPTVWTGSHLVSWNGAGLMALDAATATVAGMPASPLGLRQNPAVVWTGDEIVVWGGCRGTRCDDLFTGTDEFADGAVFDWATQEWQMMAQGPLGLRDGPEGAWTGTEVIIWGGDVGDQEDVVSGAAYTPAQDQWRSLSEAPLEARRSHTVTAWDDRILVWGGSGEIVPVDIEFGVYDIDYYGDGAIYEPETDSWEYIGQGPLDPRDRHAAIQLGHSIVIVGGCCPAGATGVLSRRP